MKSTVFALVSVLLFSTAGLAFSQPAGNPPPRQQKFLESAGLTADQVTQVTDVFDKLRASMKTQQAAIAVLDAQIRQIMVTAAPDLGAANALVDKKTAARADLEKQFLAAQAQIHKIVGDKAYDKLQGMFFHHMRGGWGQAQHPHMMKAPRPAGPRRANP